ncbi:hypothetical protein HK105_205560 [Polyrhizophydium stewartii]|uniref:Ankyrin repeat protein n=1 Tax=Polyrhizophydium stewartii TaxID=2732419 RepID=A0ABR4N5R7_9FUNG
MSLATPRPQGAAAAARLAPRSAGCRDLCDLIDRLPAELTDQIFEAAGPLTQWLHERERRPMTRTAFSLLVVDCFKQDRCDVVDQLPRRAVLSFELLFVRTRRMRQLALQFQRPETIGPLTGVELVGGRVPGRALRPLEDMVYFALDPVLEPLAHELLDLAVAACAGRTPDKDMRHAVTDCAAGLGRLDVLRAVPPRSRSAFKSAFEFACKNRRAGAMQHLAVTARRHMNLSYDGALEGGHLDIAAALRALDMPVAAPSGDAIHWALHGGHADAVWWLLRDRTMWNVDGLRHIKGWAATYGLADMLRFAIKYRIGDPVTTWVLDCAASGGQLETLKWLHARKGPQCSIEGFMRAAEGGHLETFVWLWNTLRAKRPRVDGMLDAAARGQLAVIEFFARHTSYSLKDLADEAIEHGHLEVTRLLVDMGRAAPNHETLLRIVQRGHVHCMRWLCAQLPDQPLWPDTVEIAVRRGYRAMVEFLVDERGVEISRTAIVEAHRVPENGILDFLVARCPVEVVALSLAEMVAADMTHHLVGSRGASGGRGGRHGRDQDEDSDEFEDMDDDDEGQHGVHDNGEDSDDSDDEWEDEPNSATPPAVIAASAALHANGSAAVPADGSGGDGGESSNAQSGASSMFQSLFGAFVSAAPSTLPGTQGSSTVTQSGNEDPDEQWFDAEEMDETSE